MTATGHAVIGTLIAARIGNPYLAIPLAVVSHLLADLTPHWDAGTHYKTKTKIRLVFESALDIIASVFAAYLLTIFFFPQTNILYVYLLVFCAQFFDWATVPYYFLNMKFPPFSWYAPFLEKHVNTRLDKPWGIIIQVSILLVLFFGAYYL